MIKMRQLRENVRSLKFHPSMLAIRRFKKALADFGPSVVLRLNSSRREALRNEFSACRTVGDCMEFARRHMTEGSCQILSEIKGAIDLINGVQPTIICEIGVLDGGTSVLFSRFVLTIDLAICIDLYVKNKELLRILAPPGRELRFIDRPSNSKDCIDEVARILEGRQIDVLFIDGDHRYEGVKQDFLLYKEFVREGGLVLFHDIVVSRGGRAWAGGVPLLWQELSKIYPHREFIDSPTQNGFGIGVLTYTRQTPLLP